MTLNVLDLFAGIGGFSLGLERAGMKTIAFCEKDKHCQRVLKKHWPDIPVFSDVRTFNKKILTESKISKIDVITAGFPCQDVSLLNTKGKGLKGEKSGLWKETKRLIEELKPKYAIIENVANLRTRGLAQIFKDLWSIGYDCEWHILPASIFGECPHQRARIWILAYPSRSRLNLSESKGAPSKTPTIIERYLLMQLFQTSPNKMEIRKNKNLQASDKEEETESSAVCRNERSGYSNNDLERLNQHWKIEPKIHRMVNGLSRRLVTSTNQRIKQLGNSVVPQIPEIIGNAIIYHEMISSS